MSSAYGTYVLSYFDSNMMDPSNSEGRIQTSVTVFLITLAASEVVIYTICKIMAWYAHVTFYAQGDMNWIHETTTDPSINSQDPSIPSTDTTDTADSHDPSWNDIQNALFTSMYNTAATTKERLFIPIPAPVQAPVLVPLSSNNDDDEGDDNDDDHTCPICLNDFGTLSICSVVQKSCLQHGCLVFSFLRFNLFHFFFLQNSVTSFQMDPLVIIDFTINASQNGFQNKPHVLVVGPP